jgi:RNA polymerase sigma-70 factor (ECF subfamily)
MEGSPEVQRADAVRTVQVHERGSTRDEDGVLIDRIAVGDRDALGELYARFQRPLFRYLCQMTPDRGLAEEILQDTLVAVWQGAASFERRSAVQTWLFGIARRQAHNALRRRGMPVDTVESAGDVVDQEPLPEQQVLAQADLNELASGIARLAPVYREVLVLKFVNGLAYDEIARIVGIPEGTVKSRLNAARRTLRELMAQSASPDRAAERPVDRGRST